MKKTLFFILSFIIICSSCSKEKLFFYEEEEGMCAFLFNDNICMWGSDNHEVLDEHLKDSLEIFNFEHYFIKKEIEVEKATFDSIYMANVIDLYEDWNKNVVLYNAKIIKNEWTVAIYYPFDYKGTYVFTLLPQEEKMFHSILSLNINQDECQNQKMYRVLVDKNDDRYVHYNHSFLMNVYNDGEEKSLFAYFPEKTQNMYRLLQLTSVIINNHIRTDQLERKEIGLIEVRNKFDQTFFDEMGEKSYFVHDVDSMTKWLDETEQMMKEDTVFKDL